VHGVKLHVFSTSALAAGAFYFLLWLIFTQYPWSKRLHRTKKNNLDLNHDPNNSNAPVWGSNPCLPDHSLSFY